MTREKETATIWRNGDSKLVNECVKLHQGHSLTCLLLYWQPKGYGRQDNQFEDEDWHTLGEWYLNTV
uniref:Uncharacterized protein n=1 Tax=Nelumbo nucifera TaxID=4432 RepID=A0A822ZFR0_NELNU|nr:TPA_asm: hypothetical protein HUJ06_016189 [Nelumbo nucifera]